MHSRLRLDKNRVLSFVWLSALELGGGKAVLRDRSRWRNARLQLETPAVGFADEAGEFGRVGGGHRPRVPLDAFAGIDREQADQQRLRKRGRIPEARG